MVSKANIIIEDKRLNASYDAFRPCLRVYIVRHLHNLLLQKSQSLEKQIEELKN
jgi:hypothetical protein